MTFKIPVCQISVHSRSNNCGRRNSTKQRQESQNLPKISYLRREVRSKNSNFVRVVHKQPTSYSKHRHDEKCALIDESEAIRCELDPRKVISQKTSYVEDTDRENVTSRRYESSDMCEEKPEHSGYEISCECSCVKGEANLKNVACGDLSHGCKNPEDVSCVTGSNLEMTGTKLNHENCNRIRKFTQEVPPGIAKSFDFKAGESLAPNAPCLDCNENKAECKNQTGIVQERRRFFERCERPGMSRLNNETVPTDKQTLQIHCVEECVQEEDKQEEVKEIYRNVRNVQSNSTISKISSTANPAHKRFSNATKNATLELFNPDYSFDNVSRKSIVETIRSKLFHVNNREITSGIFCVVVCVEKGSRKFDQWQCNEFVCSVVLSVVLWLHSVHVSHFGDLLCQLFSSSFFHILC